MDSWNKPVAGIGLERLAQKMFRLKHELKIFSRNNVGDVAMEYKEVMIAKDRYTQLLRQQSKIKWIKFNDKNSRYFHMAMRKTRMENRITTFMKGDTIVDNFKEVVKPFVNHFETFLGIKSNASGSIDVNCIKQGKCLNLEQQVNLIRPFNKGRQESFV
uniref:Reverse transcriptase n=1 Tax=Cannabis sativa TaxID=3483 RepID=A0A803Q1Q8_CANSA